LCADSHNDLSPVSPLIKSATHQAWRLVVPVAVARARHRSCKFAIAGAALDSLNSKDNYMLAIPSTNRSATLEPDLHEVKEAWSPDERQAGRELAYRRFDDFLTRLIENPKSARPAMTASSCAVARLG
jgi:hypothetical protein